ncbi:MAG TPA: hypothetical protein VF696_00115 [Candidatus Paceibacterota bacterium]|jgi:Tfp pilus assembly protein PilN
MKNRTRSIAVPVIAVPDRIVPMLGVAAVALVAVYIVLVITTIFFAAWQTQLASTIDETRGSIQALETEYYSAIARIDATDPSSIGLVAPAEVHYVVAARPTGLTFAR